MAGITGVSFAVNTKTLQSQYQYPGALQRDGQYRQHPTGVGVYDQIQQKHGLLLFGCNDVLNDQQPGDHARLTSGKGGFLRQQFIV
jgi:hypothetical protein